MTLAIDWTLVGEPRYRLRLERESDTFWIVAHHDTVFLRTPDREFAERFMFAFADKHGVGSIDLDSIELERECAAARAVAWTRTTALARREREPSAAQPTVASSGNSASLSLAPVVRLSDRKIVA